MKTVDEKLLNKIKDDVALKFTGQKWEDIPDRHRDIYVNYVLTRYLEEIPLTDLLAVKALPTERDIYIAANEYSDKENFRSGKHKSYISVNFVAGAKWALSKFPVSEAGEQEKEAILFFRWAISNHKWREDLGLQGLFVIPTNDNREDFYTLEEMYDKFKATAPIEKK